jgi:hypothetical protein
MIVERTHTTQIEIKDPQILYSVDIKDALKKNLTERYVNKCFKKSFVIEILEIIRYCPPICERERVGGSARVVLTFKFKAIVYDRFEVIPDARIIEIMEDERIICRSKYVSIMLMPNPKLQKYTKGQMIPVRVVNCKYSPMRPTIGAQGIPFVPLRIDTDKEYEVNIVSDDQKLLEPLIKKYEEEYKRFETLCGSKDVIKNWLEFLGPKQTKPPVNYNIVDIRRLEGSGMIIRNEWTNLDDLNVYFKPEKSEQIIKNSVHVLRGYLNSSIKQLQTASSLVELYDLKSADPWIDVYKNEK